MKTYDTPPDEIVFRIDRQLLSNPEINFAELINREVRDSFQKCGWDILLMNESIAVLQQQYEEVDKGLIWIIWSITNENEFKKVLEKSRQEEFRLR